MKEHLYFTEVIVPMIIFMLFLFGTFFYLDQKNMKKQFDIIQTQQEQIIILLSKDYPDYDLLSQIKAPKPKMEK